ncbi:hypothetical protein Vretimale_3166 [Volvox reticuliferus]|uniref:Protein kinase domain-containing protein n=1 Tax=Volvox reticuliferus TaxID=1737510 RepID=A0A8J4G3D5_9CHLO|nr:hypothetical protein Vretifemale_6581 [Volvox reticuliferus]GIL97512.1 hypothetical protein Vretimale_3166 [Volvox reticuliferus]
MFKFLSLCLGGEQPAAPKTPAAQPTAEPAPVDDRRTSITPVEHQWQALYDGLQTVRGTWRERLCQVMSLAAACCGTAFVSVHLFCPYHACFVVISSGGPQAEMMQPGDLQPADFCVSPASLHIGRFSTNLGTFGQVAGFLAMPGEPNSLQLLLRGKVTICRSIPPGLAQPSVTLRSAINNGGAATDPSVLPPDWRRMHHNAHFTDFAAVPILDADGSVFAALTLAGPAVAAASVLDADGDGIGNGGSASPHLSMAIPQLEVFARVLGLAFFSDPKQLPMYSLVASTLAAVQRAETLQAMVETIHEGFGALLEWHCRLEGARCVLAFADSMEARVAYFGPPAAATAGAGPPTPVGCNPASSAASAHIGSGGVVGTAITNLSRGNVMSGSSQQGAAGSGTNAVSSGTSAPLQGVLGPLMDTLLLDVVTREAPGSGRVITNCRAYLQQEDKPGRDVQVSFQLCRMPPACLALAVAGAADTTLAPEVALYVCTAQQQLPGGVLEEVRAEMQCMLQLLMPHIHRQLLGPLAAEWGGMRLQGGGGAAPTGGAQSGCGASSAGGEGASVSVNSVLGGLSGAISLGGLCRSVSFSVDDLVSHSPAHLKVVVAGIQSTITAAQMSQAWQAAGDSSTRESIDDLYSIRLRETVGQGGQGVVFRGLMHGLEVAVKVVAKDMPGALIAKVQQQQQQQATAASRRGGGGGGGPAAAAVRPIDPEQVLRTAKRELIRDALELAVTSAVNHPHIVQVHNYFFDVLVVGYAQDDGSSAPARLPDSGGGANGTQPPILNVSANNYLRLVRRVDATEEMVSEGPTNLVIVMEYCDAGTLKDVLRRGYFKRGVDANGWPRLDLTSMYICLLEVALALRHMHSLALVHCDLKPSNVLLRSHPRDPRGWTCKLSDFGCVRMLKPPAEDGSGPTFPHFTVTRALGTLTHMAPEVISKGALLTSSVDVYSFGIMMAELMTGVPQDQCMPGKEAIQLARKGVRPTLPPYCPKEYRDVATACWSHDPHFRPTAAELVNVLQLLLNQVQGNSQSSGGFGQALPHIFQQQLTAGCGRNPGAGAAGPRAAAAASPALGPNGGRTLAAAAAMAAAIQQVNAGGGNVVVAGNNPTAATAAALASNNIDFSPLQAPTPPQPQPAPVGVAAAAGGGGDGVERVLASALSASLQHHVMLQQVQQQMQMHQQQHKAQQHHQMMRQALQQMAQLQAQQQQQQQPEQLSEPLQMPLLQEQELQQQHMQEQQQQRDLLSPPSCASPPVLAQQPPQPQQGHQQEQKQVSKPSAFMASSPTAATGLPSAGFVASNYSGAMGPGVAVGTPKPSSFTSAASAFSAAGAVSPTASSLSSSARQLPAQPNPTPATQQVPTYRDAAGTAAAIGAAVTSVVPPIVLPGSPIAVAESANGQTSSPMRSEYDSPAEQNFSGTCVDPGGAQQMPTCVGATAADVADAALYATIDAYLLYNTPGSTPVREQSCGQGAEAANGGASST